jgi:hypothetical protein
MLRNLAYLRYRQTGDNKQRFRLTSSLSRMDQIYIYRITTGDASVRPSFNDAELVRNHENQLTKSRGETYPLYHSRISNDWESKATLK